jgi:hypothetical protein
MIRDCVEDRTLLARIRDRRAFQFSGPLLAWPVGIPTVDEIFELNARGLIAAGRSVLNWPSPARSLADFGGDNAAEWRPAPRRRAPRPAGPARSVAAMVVERVILPRAVTRELVCLHPRAAWLDVWIMVAGSLTPSVICRECHRVLM